MGPRRYVLSEIEFKTNKIPTGTKVTSCDLVYKKLVSN